MKTWLGLGLVVVLTAAGLMVPTGGGSVSVASQRSKPVPADLGAFSDAPPGAPLPLVFIHHSVGGVLLADPGKPDAIADSVWRTHPEGGGLRAGLKAAGYQVHEASYGSFVGHATDLFDWLPKFRDSLNRILKVEENDKSLPGDQQNRIVVFKSCYPNNAFVGDGDPPGDPTGPQLTIANAKSTLGALLPVFAKHPDVLFVYVTAPPLAPGLAAEPAWKWLLKTALGKPPAAERLRYQGEAARRFNDWVVSKDGWLAGSAGKNVVVFDLYDILTGRGRSDLLVYPTGGGLDSHPAAAGNQEVAAAFVPVLNRAVRRAELVK